MEDALSGSPNPALRPIARKVPAGLVGMIVLVIAVESIVNFLRPDFSPSWAEDWRFASISARDQAPGCQVLCLGDSMVKYGVLPRVIEARTGLKTYNLACAGGTMPSEFFVFRQAVEAGARPRAIVIDFAALMLPDPDPSGLRSYAELATYRDCLDLAWTSKSSSFLAASWLSKTFPSIKWRFEIQGAILASLGNRPFSPRSFMPAIRSKWVECRGAQPMDPVPVRPPVSDFLLDGVSPESWYPTPRNEAYLDRLLKLAEDHGITVFWLMPPLVPEVHDRRDRRGVDAVYSRFALGKQVQFPNVVILDARRSGYDDSVHTDHLHLDKRGASVLSLDIASALARRFGIDGPVSVENWEKLPSFAGRVHETTPEALARFQNRPSTSR